MKLNFINSWKAKNKQSDKVKIEIRISKLTIFNIEYDRSDFKIKIMIFNFGIEFSAV